MHKTSQKLLRALARLEDAKTDARTDAERRRGFGIQYPTLGALRAVLKSDAEMHAAAIKSRRDKEERAYRQKARELAPISSVVQPRWLARALERRPWLLTERAEREIRRRPQAAEAAVVRALSESTKLCERKAGACVPRSFLTSSP
jgi:hypothetical protein